MTKLEFWSQLDALTRSSKTYEQIPPLILEARREHLSIPVVFDSFVNPEPDGTTGEPAILCIQNKLFIRCATSLYGTEKLPLFKQNQFIGESELDGFFEDLLECGYSGIAFLSSYGFVGIEWRGFAPGKIEIHDASKEPASDELPRTKHDTSHKKGKKRRKKRK